MSEEARHGISGLYAKFEGYDARLTGLERDVTNLAHTFQTYARQQNERFDSLDNKLVRLADKLIVRSVRLGAQTASGINNADQTETRIRIEAITF